MPEPLQDPYATLGLPRDATAAQILSLIHI